MHTPEEVAERLTAHLHAEDIDYGTHEGTGVKYLTYICEFTEYKTLSLLRKQLERVEDDDLSFVIDGIEPTLYQSASKIEARQAVYITETADRRELENRNLEEFTG